ncbi:Histone-lysine N-methyltransferase- H3 lysine-9 specific SUVH4 [Striga hermonthica]|uniref:Histone-lysine N-methyltransferase- H3 lysine-9 specific SUVH4 n=1 Tax=Striga hermonthica TaxID=68872 RepID=A0A9N7NPR0_STRHE|nr:Histone-lysine N-methyltransferase- H3 lysine-9 specific SUVH4 [Striga hermonthica]
MVVLYDESDPHIPIDAYPMRRTSARLKKQGTSEKSNHTLKRKADSPASVSKMVGTGKKKTTQKLREFIGDSKAPEVTDGCDAAADVQKTVHESPEVLADEKLPEFIGDSKAPEMLADGCDGAADVQKAVHESLEVLAVGCDGVAAVPKNVHAEVIDTLRAFNKHYLHFIQEEENRCARLEADKKVTTKDTKSKKVSSSEDYKKPSKRPDLKAITEMMKTGATLYPDKRFGSIPGIDVGHQFFSRAEMVVVGFHQHWLNGIDYIGKTAASGRKSRKSLDLRQYMLPLAISIVLSGQYEDDLDNCEEIVYTGQGGNNLLGDKRQISDQKLERGNLGLKNCMEQSVPVRVVRGHKCSNSYVGKVYTYDGLYKVVNYWAEKGVSGFTVYKYRLKRLEGQPPLTTKEVVYFTRGRIPKSLSEIRGLVSEDITGGLEDIPILVTNLVDEPPISPLGFVYITNMKYSPNISVPTIAPVGCDCKGSCTDARRCACAKLNGGDFPYVHRDGGRLVEPKAVVFECGPKCGCGPSCVNRTSQHGPRFRFEVFKTPKKGWGVRSWDYIPSGAPICEYIGLLKRTADLDPSADNSYVFDIDCIQTMKGLDGREVRLADVSLPSHLLKFNEEASENVPFCIDAGKTGNFARFINHSCQPNLFVQCMLSSHHDLKQARIMLIAADNIPPLKELTYDYGYALDSVMGPDGKIQKLACFCGAEGCRKRLF